MKEITTTKSARVFEYSPRGGLLTLALAHHPETDEPEIAVMLSHDEGNVFLSRGVGTVVMARVMQRFNNTMPTVEQVLEFNNEDGAQAIHEKILADYVLTDVVAIWDAVMAHLQAGKQSPGLHIPHPAAESDIQATLDLLGAQPQGHA